MWFTSPGTVYCYFVPERRFPEFGSSRKGQRETKTMLTIAFPAVRRLFPPRSDLRKGSPHFPPPTSTRTKHAPGPVLASGQAVFPRRTLTGPKSAKPFSPAKSHPSSWQALQFGPLISTKQTRLDVPIDDRFSSLFFASPWSFLIAKNRWHRLPVIALVSVPSILPRRKQFGGQRGSNRIAPPPLSPNFSRTSTWATPQRQGSPPHHAEGCPALRDIIVV